MNQSYVFRSVLSEVHICLIFIQFSVPFVMYSDLQNHSVFECL